MKWYDYFIKYFLGILFIFSGLVKINDPVGTSIKLKEYFEVFEQDFSSLFSIFIPFSLPIAIFVIVFEIMLGAALLLNFRLKLVSWLFIVLIAFFSFLTFYSAYFNKVTDCGCFGDAIPLKPWQSFIKDVILAFFVIMLFLRKEKFNTSPLPSKVLNGLIVALTLINIFIAWYAVNYLPFIDFLPYKAGNDIPALMKPSEPYRYKYIMEKDGKIFSFKEYPSDTTYAFKEMVILNPGAAPKITDYHIWNDEVDFTDSSFTGNKLFIIMYDVNKANIKNIERINGLISELEGKVDVLILTSSSAEDIESFRHEHQLAVPYYFSDMTVLETIVRSNPGLWLLKDGVVVGKWHHNRIPGSSAIQNLLK